MKIICLFHLFCFQLLNNDYYFGGFHETLECFQKPQMVSSHNLHFNHNCRQFPHSSLYLCVGCPFGHLYWLKINKVQIQSFENYFAHQEHRGQLLIIIIIFIVSIEVSYWLNESSVNDSLLIDCIHNYKTINRLPLLFTTTELQLKGIDDRRIQFGLWFEPKPESKTKLRYRHSFCLLFIV